MHSLLEQFHKSKNAESLNCVLKDKNVINFTTLNNVNLYFVYDPQKTSFGNLVNTLFNNYNCKHYDRNDMVLYSNQFKKTLCDIDPNTKMSDIGFDKITRINILTARDAQRKMNIDGRLSDGELSEKVNNLKMQCDEAKKLEENSVQNLSIHTLTGRTLSLETLSSFLVSDIKTLLFSSEGIPEDQQRIIFFGKQLDDNQTLSSCGIQDGSKLHLVLRLRGGMFHETSGKAGNYGVLESCTIYVVNDI